jgi:hypothetical protein
LSLTARTALLIALCLALLAAPAASAGSSARAQGSQLIHLTGVVAGSEHKAMGSQCQFPSELALDEGNRSVGTVHIKSCMAVGTFIRYHGWTKLTVGPLRGKAFLVIRFFSTSQGQEPFGQGHLTRTAGAKTGFREGIKVANGRVSSDSEVPIPVGDGTELSVVLRPAGPFPSRAPTS